MAFFSISLMLIFIGGVRPVSLTSSFKQLRAESTLWMAAGCAMGLWCAVGRIFEPAALTGSFRLFDPFDLAFRLDPLAGFFLAAIFGVSMLAVIYSYHYLDEEEKAWRTAGCQLFTALLIIGMALVVAADNLITFLVFWEIMSLSSLFLVLYNYESEENREAGFLYAVYSQVGALFILAAFGLVYAHTGRLGFDALTALPENAKLTVFCLALVGLGSKAGVFPLHAWLPRAHPAAPSHISALMSGVMIKTGIYGIVRLYDLLAWPGAIFGQIVLTAGVISGVLGIVYALGQRDLKRLLAYSSVENVGIILIGIGLGMVGVSAGQPLMAALGFTGGLLHLLNHSLFKSLLFMGAGMVLHQTGTRAIDTLGGLVKRMPVTGTTFLVGSLAVSGLPPFNGFAGEFLIYFGAFRGVALGGFDFALGLLGIVGLAVIGGLALACFTKVVGVVFQGEPRSPAAAEAREHGATMLAPMVILAAACLLIGVFPPLFAGMALRAAGALRALPAQGSLGAIIELTSGIAGAAAVALVVLLGVLALRALAYRGKRIGRSGTWGCGFTRPTVGMQYTGSSYAASILDFFRPVAPLSEEHPPIQGRFPAPTHYQSQIHDIAETSVGRLLVRPVLFLFDQLRWLQHGDIHLYIGYILLAIIVLLFFV